MRGDGDADDTSDLEISASFVARAAYLAMRDELLEHPGGVWVKLSQDDTWEWPLLDLLLMLLLLPSLLTIATLFVHHLRLVQSVTSSPFSLPDFLARLILSSLSFLFLFAPHL